jgi:uncharacterized membrane protein YtjA (UPF0391 family)
MLNQNAKRIKLQDFDRRPNRAQPGSILVVNRIILRLTLGVIFVLLITGVLGFGIVPGYSWEGARILFYIFLAISCGLTLLALLSHAFRGPA